jgi:hypothetical protein
VVKTAHRRTGFGGGVREPRNGRSHRAVTYFRQGTKPKMLRKYVRSRNVCDNKQISDTLPGKKSDIYVLDSDIYV